MQYKNVPISAQTVKKLIQKLKSSLCQWINKLAFFTINAPKNELTKAKM